MAKGDRGGSRYGGGSGGIPYFSSNAPVAFRAESEEQRSFNDAQFNALNSQLQRNYGLTLDQSLRDRVDFKGIRDSIYGVESVLREFPGASQYLSGATLTAGDEDPGAYASASSYSNTVKLGSGMYMDYRTVGVLMQNDVEHGWHPRGSSAISVAQHETGHLISYAAARRLGMDISSQGSKNLAMKTIVERAMSTPAVKNWMKANKLTRRAARKSISGYASVSYRNGSPNYNETIAEAVSDYMSNRSNANVLSRAIVRELKNAFR